MEIKLTISKQDYDSIICALRSAQTKAESHAYALLSNLRAKLANQYDAQQIETHQYESSVSPGVCRICGRSIHVHAPY